MTIKLRRDTAANWASVNPVLASGQPGWDTTNEELRIGDGVSTWSALTPIGGGGAGTTNLTWTASTSTVASDTGTDAVLTVADGTNPGLMTSANFTKLAGVATGATANSSDATLLARANHTGTQTASTISDFSEAVDDRVASLLVAGSNITLTYNDVANTLTVASSGGSGATSGTATLNFGAAPGGQLATVAVTGQTGLLSGSNIRVWIQGEASADHSEYEHTRVLSREIGLSVDTITAGVGFTIVGVTELQLTGTVAVRWQWD